MTAGMAYQTALVSELQNVAGVTGVYDGAPARATYPYVVVDASTELDWSNKSTVGREIAVAVTLWDDQPERLHDVAGDVEAAAAGVTAVAGWSLVNLRFQRKRVVRDTTGPWALALDYRARLLQSD